MNFRLATAHDNEALLELTKKAPMIGTVVAYVDRRPNFFKLSELQGESFEVWVAEHDDKIIGSVSCVARNVRYDGKVVKQLYGCDLKVDPHYRSIKLGKELARLYISKAAALSDCTMGEVEVINNNRRSLNIVSWLGGEMCPSSFAGNAITYQIMPYKKYRELLAYNIRRARVSDIPLIGKILHETYKDYDSSPLFDAQEIDRALKIDPSFTIDSFRVAEQSGRVVACAAFWDQSSLRRTIVEKFPRSFKFMMPLLKSLRLFFKIPRLPKSGEELKYIFLRYPACAASDVEALRAILHHESNQLRNLKEYHFIWAGFHELDPLQKALSEMWKMRFNVNIFHFDVKGELGLNAAHVSRPTYVDLSLI